MAVASTVTVDREALAGPQPLAAILRRKHLPALDGLRAVSVFIVMAYHFGFPGVPGDLGVSFFFVLSGFLITWLLLREHRRSGEISLRRFYLRRVLRIFPAYYAFLLTSFAIDYLRGQHWSPGLLWSGVLYVVNYYNALHGHPNTSISHAWSLGVEEQFYFLWPLTLILLLKLGKRRAPAVLSLIMLAVVAWRSYLYLSVHVGSAYVYNAFDTRFDNLAIGCLLALLVERHAFVRCAKILASNPLLPLLTAGLIIWSRRATPDSYHYSLGFTVDAVLIGVLMLQLLQLSRSVLWSWLDHPVVRYLGVISYPLYLWHQWGLDIGHWLRGDAMIVQFAVGVGVCVLVASGSYFFVEKPFLALKTRLEPRVLGASSSALTEDGRQSPPSDLAGGGVLEPSPRA